MSDSTVFSLHASLHRLPPEPSIGYQDIGGLQLPIVRPSGPLPELPLSFEQAIARLETLARLFAEPDGSFVWTHGQPDWCLNGQLEDGTSGVQTIQVRGTVSLTGWNRLIERLELQPAELIVQITRLGVFVPGSEYPRFAIPLQPT